MSIPHSKFASVCSFAFADGRRCRTPRASRQSPFCHFHAQKKAEAEARRKIGHDIGTWVTTDFLSACDLSRALGMVFSQTLQGRIKPKTTTAIAYLSQAMLQSIKFAEHEFSQAYDGNAWRRAIRLYTPEPTGKPVQPAAAPANATIPPDEEEKG